MLPSKKYQDELKTLKSDVEQSESYFKKNNARWNASKRRIFLNSLTSSDIQVLRSTKKPQLSFSLEEAYISRLRGEFSKQEPSVIVRSDYGNKVSGTVCDTVEGIIRHIFMKSKQNGTEYGLFTDMLSGGYGVAKVITKYANNRLFHQVIEFGKCHNPTKCGFDPLAIDPHKGDGRYAYEIFPKLQKEVEEEYGVKLNNDESWGGTDDFSWRQTSSSTNDRVIMLCDYYKKKKVKKTIIELTDGNVIEEKEYDEYISDFLEKNPIEQAPYEKDRRIVYDDIICRYIFVGTKVLKYEETDYTHLPYVFFDGNSAEMQGEDGKWQQYTRSYAHNSEGIQRLANFIGNCYANDLENMVQHKLMICDEAMNNKYKDSYDNFQEADVIGYNAYSKQDPNKQLPPPIVVNRAPLDPLIQQSFVSAPQMMQAILGSYDASLGINDNQLSGLAIQEGASQSNATAMPVIVGYLQGLNRVANIIIDLIPKYYITPATIPVVDKHNKKNYIEINTGSQQSVDMTYDSNALHVVVEPGLNFTVQKAKSLNVMLMAMQSNPTFGQFVSQECLPEFIDNLEMRHIDTIKEKAEMFIKKVQMQQQQQMQMQQQSAQMDPRIIRAKTDAQRLMLEADQNKNENMLAAAELSIESEKMQNDRMKLLHEMKNDERNSIIQMDKHQTEKERMAVDLTIKAAQMHQQHGKDVHEMHLKHKKHSLDERKIVQNLNKVNPDE